MTEDAQTQSDAPESQESLQPRRSRAERREQAASDVLRTLIRDLYVGRFGSNPPSSEELDLTLQLKTHPTKNWELEFSPSLAEQLISQVEDAQADRDVYRKGRVHCFRCDSSECEHSLPSTPLSVFRGYEPNGVPEWSELAQVCIEAKDERVDRLFSSSADALTIVQLGRDLRVRQLSSFGRSSKTYSILGQVIAGYFKLPNGGDGPARIAVSMQVVETRGANGTPHFKLNTVALMPNGEALSDLLGSGWQHGLHRAQEMAKRELSKIEQHVRSAREHADTESMKKELRRVPSVLRQLAESIERSGRQDSRRTRHAEERRRDHRPVHKALDEARSAAVSSLYFDEKARTTIACGPQGRAHVFNPDGRHVTSFSLSPGAVDFRLRTRRWHRITADEAARFKEQIENFIPKRKGPPEAAKHRTSNTEHPTSK